MWVAAAVAATSARRIAGRSADASERISDDVTLATDPGVRALRAARTTDRRPPD
jgi:hypothetical protein